MSGATINRKQIRPRHGTTGLLDRSRRARHDGRGRL